MLHGPIAAALIFAVLATWIITNSKLTGRQKGARLMVLGLFWLFAYDASILLANRQWLSAVAIAGLFACSWLSFLAMRLRGRMLPAPVSYRTAPDGISAART